MQQAKSGVMSGVEIDTVTSSGQISVPARDWRRCDVATVVIDDVSLSSSPVGSIIVSPFEIAPSRG